jgi:hypothetical protein
MMFFEVGVEADHRVCLSCRGGASVLFLVMPPYGKDSHDRLLGSSSE